MTNPPAKTLGNRAWISPGFDVQGLKGVPSSRRLAWLDLLRSMAVLLVLWGHLVGAFLAARKASWAPNDAVKPGNTADFHSIIPTWIYTPSGRAP